VSLGILWFVYGQQQIKTHHEAASLEPIVGQGHFLVLLSIVALFGELAKVCREGKCSRLHAHYTWLVPPCIALVFDILTLQRQIVFYHDNKLFNAIAVYALVLSITTSLWTLLVIKELKRYA